MSKPRPVCGDSENCRTDFQSVRQIQVGLEIRPTQTARTAEREDGIVGTEPNGAIARLTAELGKLPGIGPKSAERLTHYLLGADRESVLALSDALRAVK